MTKKRITIFLAVSLAVTLVFAAAVRQIENAKAQKEAQASHIQQDHSEKIHAQRKAQLVQRINRYWQLRDEAVRRGIDLTQVPVMPYVVGSDGNIYRLLPNGQCQVTPDDYFNDPVDLYAQQWTDGQARETQKQHS